MAGIASKSAQNVAVSYGPAFTKVIRDGDLSAFRELFTADEPIAVVLQNAEGKEVDFTVGDQEGATMTWEDFQKVCSQDLDKQDFQKLECQCLGVLGDRAIFETGRFNSAGEVYTEAYSLFAFNEAGKIIMIEAFSDTKYSGLLEAGAGAKE